MPERKVIITYRSLGNGLTPCSVTWSCWAEAEPKPHETVKMPARIRAGIFVSFAICLISFSFLISKFQFLYSWLVFGGKASVTGSRPSLVDQHVERNRG